MDKDFKSKLLCHECLDKVLSWIQITQLFFSMPDEPHPFDKITANLKTKGELICESCGIEGKPGLWLVERKLPDPDASAFGSLDSEGGSPEAEGTEARQ